MENKETAIIYFRDNKVMMERKDEVMSLKNKFDVIILLLTMQDRWEGLLKDKVVKPSNIHNIDSCHLVEYGLKVKSDINFDNYELTLVLCNYYLSSGNKSIMDELEFVKGKKANINTLKMFRHQAKELKNKVSAFLTQRKNNV